MKKNIIILFGFLELFFILITPPIFAGDWTRNDTYRELAFEGLLIVDYLQTRTIVQNPDKYFEYNPIVGKHPNQQSVDIYMISCVILHPIISYYLPPNYRKWWQYISIGVEIGAISNNVSAGIGISF